MFALRSRSGIWCAADDALMSQSTCSARMMWYKNPHGVVTGYIWAPVVTTQNVCSLKFAEAFKIDD